MRRDVTFHFVAATLGFEGVGGLSGTKGRTNEPSVLVYFVNLFTCC
jgi:hypothetical protein